ncbi:MAG: CAP domain-containing protein [Oscillospiraceae bacterium]
MKKLIILTLVLITAVYFSACDEADSSSNVIEVEATTTAASETVTTAPEVTATKPVTTIVTTIAPAETQTTTTAAQAADVPEATTAAPAVTTAAVTTTKPITTTPTTTTTVPATTTAAPVTTAASASARQAGFQADIQTECLRILNEYRAANGVPAISLDNSWKIYAERLSKFNADNNLISHGPTAIEIVGNPKYHNPNGSATEIANMIMDGYKNSYAHNLNMLDIYNGDKTHRMTSTYCAVYYEPSTQRFSTIIVLKDVSYSKYYPAHKSALGAEVWWDNGGSWDGVTGTIYRDWSEADLKAEFDRKGLSKYYPHLA